MSESELIAAERFADHMEQVNLPYCAEYVRILVAEIRRLKAEQTKSPAETPTAG